MKNLRYFIILFLSLSLQADFIVKSYQEIKNQKAVRQNYEESCGASAYQIAESLRGRISNPLKSI
ncbi:MAG: hypothetical protein J1E31_04440 [Helicobacter sp.]|nr:hypothetical protein [Helicobacter sp.]